ncbi:MAG: PQQ-binding-like beta-propeller repeat protein [Candidatus Aenigmarchaeota archaeon]|nr:PQQ-binding-like beta-propeller repeat protein [Candidatus Aenigmarchaeota archaeon]
MGHVARSRVSVRRHTQRIGIQIFLVVILAASAADTAYAAESFDFSCETPVTVIQQFDGEIKYDCIVENTGDSFLQLYYEVQPEQNPINPGLAIGFHPQPSNIFLEAGEKQPIVGFEVPPQVPAGQNEISFERTITVRPAEGFENPVEARQATITTIVKDLPVNDETRVSGKILDAQTGQVIEDADLIFRYKKFERKTFSQGGAYGADLPALPYLMMVQAKGYELFSGEIAPKSGEELKMDIRLNRAKEEGSYTLVKELHLDSGAWEGVWRAAVSGNGQYFAFGVGGQRVKTDSYESYFYLFDASGKQLLKMKAVDEIRGIDLSYDGSLIAVSLGYSQFGGSDIEQVEKVMVFRKDGELVWKKYAKNSAFQEVRFSHDGKFIAAGDTEGYVYLLDATDGSEIWKRFTRGQVRAIRFYDDDSHLLVGSGDDHVYLFDREGNNEWKTYVHSWSYGFIAATPGNAFSAAGGHVGYLHLLDKNGKDMWAYEAEGGFRWAEIGPEASFVVGGTRSELAFLDAQGDVLWKGYDSVSGWMTKDKRYIISGNQKGELELRDTGGTILWEHRTPLLEPGMDMRFSYISDDATAIVGAAKTGDVYFFAGEISSVSPPLETGTSTIEGNTEIADAPQAQSDAENLPQNNLWWMVIPVGAAILAGIIILLYIRKKK